MRCGTYILHVHEIRFAGNFALIVQAPQAPQYGLSDDDVSRLAAALLLKLQGTPQSPAEASLVKEISAELQDPPDQPTKASAGKEMLPSAEESAAVPSAPEKAAKDT